MHCEYASRAGRGFQLGSSMKCAPLHVDDSLSYNIVGSTMMKLAQLDDNEQAPVQHIATDWRNKQMPFIRVSDREFER